MAQAATDSPHVLIIGAGITGLLLAQGLKKVGIGYQIFEAESQGTFRPREWSMAIHWSLPALEKALPQDLWETRRKAQSDPFYIAGEKDFFLYSNAETGERLKEIPTMGGSRFSRRKLRAHVAQGIDVQYSKVLESITFPDDKSVVAHFSDGSTATGSLLVGTDGPRSKTRTKLLGPEIAAPKSLDLCMSHIVIQYGDAEKSRHVRYGAHEQLSLGLHPNGTMVLITPNDVPDPDDPATWKMEVVVGWLAKRDLTLTNADRLKLVKERALHLAEPWKSANLWLPDGTPCPFDDISYWIPRPWDNHDGRVTLAGDAAHAMPPHRGQGLNHCICDIGHLLDAIQTAKDNGNLAAEISAYETEMITRTAEEVALSCKSLEMSHDWDKLMNSPIMQRGWTKGS